MGIGIIKKGLGKETEQSKDKQREERKKKRIK